MFVRALAVSIPLVFQMVFVKESILSPLICALFIPG